MFRALPRATGAARLAARPRLQLPGKRAPVRLHRVALAQQGQGADGPPRADASPGAPMPTTYKGLAAAAALLAGLAAALPWFRAEGERQIGERLSNAAAQGSVDEMEALLEAGATVDLQDKNGTTALMLAAMFGRARAVEVLLKAGAKVGLQNNDGVTALAMAIHRGHRSIFVALREASAKADQ